MTIARAGFEASQDPRNRSWDQLDSNEREFWIIAARHVAEGGATPESVRDARMTNYDIEPWEAMTTYERGRWLRIARAMFIARNEISNSAPALAAA